MTFVTALIRPVNGLELTFPAVGGTVEIMDEQRLIKTDSDWRERIVELQSLLAEIKPLLVASEVKLSERLAEISAFEFRVRSRLEPLTKRLDQLDDEIRELKHQLRQLQEYQVEIDDLGDGLYEHWRFSTEAGAAASGEYRYREAAPSPPNQKLSADQSKKLKRLYRQLARRFHPDFALDAEDRAYRTGIMMEVNAAYALGDLKRLQELSLEPDPKPRLHTDQDLAEALLKELNRCQRRMEELELEFVRLDNHPSAELMRRAKQADREGRDLLDELASELRERIASKMVRRDVLLDEIDELSNGRPVFGGEDLAEMVYDLGLEAAFEEDPMSGFSEWQEKNRNRIDFDDIPDDDAWDGLRKMRDRRRKN